MAKDNDDSLEFDFNDLDLNDFDVDVKEDNLNDGDSADLDSLMNLLMGEETPGTDVAQEKQNIQDADESITGELNDTSIHNDEGASDFSNEDASNDFDDLFSLLGMGDVNEQEIFSSMMDSIPDSDDDNKDSDFATEEEIEEIEQNTKKTAGSSMNDIYSDVLGTVGSLADKEAEEQLLSELDDIEDRTNSKKKNKKNKKAKKEKKQPKEKKDVSVLLFGEEEPETEEEILAREKKEAKKASKKEAKQHKKEEKKKNAEVKKNAAKEKAKIKKAKELESMDPEDLKPVNKTALFISVCVFCGIALFIVLGTTIFHYALTIRKASDYFERKKYDMAYEEIIGVEVKEEDEELRDKIYTVMYVERAYLSYNIYVDMGNYEKALNMLLSGLEKYDEYYPQGMALGIEEDMDYCRNKIVNALFDDYGMNLNDAYAMIALDDTEYQIQIIEKSREFNTKD